MVGSENVAGTDAGVGCPIYPRCYLPTRRTLQAPRGVSEDCAIATQDKLRFPFRDIHAGNISASWVKAQGY